MPFLKFCPKPKRALRISSPYLAEPVQKAYQRVFASMELLKNRVNILSKRIKQLSSKFSMFTCKKHFRYNLFQVASKVLNKHVSLQHFRCTFFGLFYGSKKQKKVR